MRQRVLLLHGAVLLAALCSGLSNAAAKQTATVGGSQQLCTRMGIIRLMLLGYFVMQQSRASQYSELNMHL